MTKKPKKLQQYWYIKVPINKFPKPKFYPGQQVRIPLEDDPLGNPRFEIGEIIGMQYGVRNYRLGEWCYLICFLKCDANPSLVGSDDGCFAYESELVVDDTDI